MSLAHTSIRLAHHFPGTTIGRQIELYQEKNRLLQMFLFALFYTRNILFYNRFYRLMCQMLLQERMQEPDFPTMYIQLCLYICLPVIV